MNEFFGKVATKAADLLGSPWAFVSASALVILWAVSGPIFGFSDTWQLIINTSTTVLTFLAIFLIQNTQNRDTKAIHLKLDELLRAVVDARDEFADAESLSVDELEKRLKEMRGETVG